MRIVHECLNAMQASAGFRGPYVRNVEQEKSGQLATGFPMTALATRDPNYESFAAEDEAIHLEGDAFHIRRMLLDWLEMIDDTAATLVKNGELDPEWIAKCEARKQASLRKRARPIVDARAARPRRYG